MNLAENLREVKDRIALAAQKAGRKPEQVRLVAVSKIKPAEAVRQALAAGQVIFGENYVQEAKDKVPEVGQGPIWHFIGHLQSNKAKIAVELFHAVQTVDRLKLAKALGRHAADMGKELEVLIQVNLGGEVQKSGCTEEHAPELARAVAQIPGLKLKGLMTMPPFFDDPERARPIFAGLRNLAESLKRDLPEGAMDELSMGMSGDFEAAIAEGATLVRVGTAVFGARY